MARLLKVLMNMKISKLNIDKQHRIALKHLNRTLLPKDAKNIYSHSWKIICKEFYLLYKNAGSSDDDASQFAIAESLALRALFLKKYHSFYVIDESVIDFIKHTPLNQKDMKQIYDVVFNVVSDYRDYGFVVHMAGEDQSIIYTFGPDDRLYDPGYKNFQKGMGVQFKNFCKNEQGDIGFLSISEKDGLIGGNLLSEASGVKQWIIFFNLCLYISAFPDHVKEGAPPIKIDGLRSNSTTIKASQQMKDVYRDGVTPHIRRGHFRFLQSEVYKNKRFQAIYVKPSIVSGSASNLSEDI